MGRKQKVIALSLGQGIGSAITIGTLILMARVLSREELATYQQALLTYAFVAPILQLGLSQGIQYFLPTEKLRIRGRVYDLITLLAGTGAVFSVFILCSGNQLIARHFSNPGSRGEDRMRLQHSTAAGQSPERQRCIASFYCELCGLAWLPHPARTRPVACG